MIDSRLWNWTSPVWLVVAVLLIGYFVYARGRSRSQLAVFLFGLLMLALAFVSPVGVLANGYLFSAHMVQHLVLLLIVPACLLLSLPQEQAEKWFARPSFDRMGQWMAIASIGWICGVGAMWLWHVPTLCSTAAQNWALAIVRDLSLVVAGLIFWWPIYAPCNRYRMHPLSGIAYLFSACLGCTLLGIYITFSPITVCSVFASPIDRIGILSSLYGAGLTPGVDQHLGGLMMWVPPCGLYIAAIISLLARWYTTLDHQVSISTETPAHGSA